MTSFDFQTQTHGKWILAGEHSVLRGNTALVFPVHSVTLHLYFKNAKQDLEAQFSGTYADELPLLFWGVLEQGLEKTGQKLSQQQGTFLIENHIPIGSGLGASAALCVALARWFDYQGYLTNTTAFEFAQTLEHLFHSESSGVDIAGVSTESGLHYSRHGLLEPLEVTWKPHWYLTPSSSMGMTNHCVKKVKNFIETHPDLGKQIDDLMQKSVDMAHAALESKDENRLERLATAINSAKICFTQWDLCNGKIEECISRLLQGGAIAAKPTGSGEGGYVLSLWAAPAPVNFELPLLEV